MDHKRIFVPKMDYLNHQMTFKEIFNLKDIDVDNKGFTIQLQKVKQRIT
ncbi:5-formyltetrahydrofolate cyclo-ligase [Staphylococcus aureus]|nr:5-formyltetrahydrofolate cyclo-ligase [Staphylococcus aureus]